MISTSRGTTSLGHDDSTEPKVVTECIGCCIQSDDDEILYSDIDSSESPHSNSLRYGFPDLNARSLEYYSSTSPAPCISWLAQQNYGTGGFHSDELSPAVEFLDPRTEGGGWIKFGYDTEGKVRYSCNGEIRPIFRQALLSSGVDLYISMPDIDKGVVIPMSQYTVDTLLPTLRATFDEAGIIHNIPDESELCAFIGEGDGSSLFSSPRGVCNYSSEARCQCCVM